MEEKLKKKRSEYFDKWDKAYNKTLEEVNRIVNNLDYIKKNDDPIFQDMSLKFFSIHLANFFYFHVRKKLIEKGINKQDEKLLLTGFTNDSFLPPVNLMDQYLSYLNIAENKLEELHDEYNILNTLRNKYAHGATGETNVQITFDQFNKYFDDIKLI